MTLTIPMTVNVDADGDGNGMDGTTPTGSVRVTVISRPEPFVHPGHMAGEGASIMVGADSINESRNAHGESQRVP